MPTFPKKKEILETIAVYFFPVRTRSDEEEKKKADDRGRLTKRLVKRQSSLIIYFYIKKLRQVTHDEMTRTEKENSLPGYYLA